MSREEHIERFITATGRPVIIEKESAKSAFFRLCYGDNKQGNLPNKYAGSYTGIRQAEQARFEFVVETWDVADENNKQRKRA